MIVGADGKPLSTRTQRLCPSCGEGADKCEVVTSFGGWWRRVCLCGYVYESGRGVPPVEG